MTALRPSYAIASLPPDGSVGLAVANQPQAIPIVPGKWLFAILLCFTVAAYAKPEDMFPVLVPFHFPLVFGILAGLTYLGSLLTARIPLIWTWELGLVLLLSAWYIAGVPFAYWKTGSMHVLGEVWLKTLLIFFLLVQTLVNLSRIRKVLWAIILSELVVTSFSIFHSPRSAEDSGRLLGVNSGFLGWNFLGIAVSTTIPYIAALFISKARGFTSRALLLVTLISSIWMVALTASRGGVLGILLSVLLTSVFVLRVFSRARIVLALLLCLLIVCLLAPRVLWERLGTLWGNSQSSEAAVSATASTEQRAALLRRSLEYTGRHPIFGLGLGNFGNFSGAETGTDWLVTHNTFTQISSEAGIPALVLFVALLIVAMRRMNAIRKIQAKTADENELQLMARATLVSILSFIFGCFFANLAYDYYLFYVVAVAVGTETMACRNQQSSSASYSYSPSRKTR